MGREGGGSGLRYYLPHSYLDTGNGRDLFFYFFESRSSPKDDPVLM